jgi:hypothetical protein
MSFHHTGLWHYERIPGRKNGLEWRVADEDDDLVDVFAREEDARHLVRIHNSRLPEREGWHYC